MYYKVLQNTLKLTFIHIIIFYQKYINKFTQKQTLTQNYRHKKYYILPKIFFLFSHIILEI